MSKDSPRDPSTQVLKDLPEVHLFVFHVSPVVCCGVVVTVGEYFDNGTVEGKGVWNEPWVSFRVSALVSANKHTSQ